MIVENIRTKKRFETTRDIFERDIVAQGNDENYRIIEDDMPIEVKSLKALEIKRKKKV